METKILLSLAVTILFVYFAGAAFAQAQSNIEVRKLKENFYCLTSKVPYPVNFLAYVCKEGILLVDAGQKETGNKELAIVNLDDLEAETGDMNFVIDYMKKDPSVDSNKIGIAGFDLGGMASMLLQIQNQSVKSMISLHSGIMFEHNTKLLKESPIYDPSKLRVPLLHFTDYKEQLEKNGIIEDSSLIRMSKKVERYIVRLNYMHHRDYTSLSRLGISDGSSMNDDIKKYHEINYQIVCSYTLSFLNSFLMNDFKSKESLNSGHLSDSSFNKYYTIEHYNINK